MLAVGRATLLPCCILIFFYNEHTRIVGKCSIKRNKSAGVHSPPHKVQSGQEFSTPNFPVNKTWHSNHRNLTLAPRWKRRSVTRSMPSQTPKTPLPTPSQSAQRQTPHSSCSHQDTKGDLYSHEIKEYSMCYRKSTSM